LLGFGITFELPLVLTSLALVEFVSSKTLAANRAKILIGLWLISCFVTPGADPYSPVIVGVAFTVLYFVSEALIRLIGR
jgi:sec-independent protein translocase protein TatC